MAGGREGEEIKWVVTKKMVVTQHMVRGTLFKKKNIDCYSFFLAGKKNSPK